MQDCIFCKIIAGDIPSYKVYEDADTYAFLDIHPVNDGHTLVIPKQHVQFVHHLDDDVYQRVMATTKKTMLAIEKVIAPARVGVVIEGFDVDHAHVKIVPLTTPADIQTVHAGDPSEDRMKEIQDQLVAAIDSR